MPWVTGSRREGFRANWREGGRGSPIQHGETRDTKPEAQDDADAEAARLAGLRSLTRRPTSTATIPELLARWKLSRLSQGKAREQRCTLVVDTLTAIATTMGWKTVADITADSVDRWMIKKSGITPGMKPAEIQEARKSVRGLDKPLQMIKQFLRWARPTLKVGIDMDVLDIEKPSRPRKPKARKLTDEQVAMALATAEKIGGAEVYAALEHFALFPCRPIDVARANVRDWDAKTRTITYRDTKNGDDQAHWVHDPEHATKLDQMAAGRKGDEPLFLDPWKRRWRITNSGSAGGLSDWYRAHIGDHLMPEGQRGIYKIKKWSMSRLIVAAKGDRRAVTAVSGHRDETVVDRYLEDNDDVQRAVLSALPALPTLSEILPGPGSTAGSTAGNTGKDGETRTRRKCSPRLKKAMGGKA